MYMCVYVCMYVYIYKCIRVCDKNTSAVCRRTLTVSKGYSTNLHENPPNYFNILINMLNKHISTKVKKESNND